MAALPAWPQPEEFPPYSRNDWTHSLIKSGLCCRRCRQHNPLSHYIKRTVIPTNREESHGEFRFWCRFTRLPLRNSAVKQNQVFHVRANRHIYAASRSGILCVDNRMINTQKPPLPPETYWHAPPRYRRCAENSRRPCWPLPEAGSSCRN